MNLKNMTKSAEGTVKDPGRNLKQKSGLNRFCGCTENADVAGALNVLKKSRTGSVRPSSELGNKSAAGTVLFFAS